MMERNLKMDCENDPPESKTHNFNFYFMEENSGNMPCAQIVVCL